MGYVQHVLQPGETVLQESRLHWFIYWRAVLFLIIACAIAAPYFLTADPTMQTAALIAGGCVFGIGDPFRHRSSNQETQHGTRGHRSQDHLQNRSVQPPHNGDEPHQGRKRRCRSVILRPNLRLWHHTRARHRRQYGAAAQYPGPLNFAEPHHRSLTRDLSPQRIKKMSRSHRRCRT